MLDNIDRDQHYVGEFQLDGENLPGEIYIIVNVV